MKKHKIIKTAVLSWKRTHQAILDDIQGREVTADNYADAPLFYNIKVLNTKGKDINNTAKIEMDKLRKQLREQGYKHFMIISGL